MSKKSFNAAEVRSMAEGRWKEIYEALCPTLQPALKRVGRHVACPVHGGSNGFRLYPNFNKFGAGVCNTCGKKAGFDLLMWVNNWSFAEAVNAVGELLGVTHTGSMTLLEDPVRFEGIYKSLSFISYKHKANANKSYCAVLENMDGDIEVWGKDLKRALERVKFGDYIRITKMATQDVQVSGKTVKKTVFIAKVVKTPMQREAEAKAKAEEEAQSAKHRREAIDALWTQSQPIGKNNPQSLPAMRYLARRGLTAGFDPEVMRFAPAVAYYEGQKIVGQYPAILLSVSDRTGQRVTVHRIYLTNEGRKAPVETPKKLMAVPNDVEFKCGVIRLNQQIGQAIAIAEGIETALAVTTGTGLCCWSTISAQFMKTFVPPEGVRMVHIFADKDASNTGQEAAEELQARLKEMGIKSRIYLPKREIEEGEKGVDWNDVLVEQGRFPTFV